MSTTTRQPPPKTPYEVRIRTELWIRRQFPTDYKAQVDRLWRDNQAYRDASMAMERLDSVEHAAMPMAEKLQAMMAQGRIMVAEVRAVKKA